MEGEPVTVPVFEEDGFQYRPEAIREKITEKTRGIFINSPSNPTGNLLSADRMRAIAAMAAPGGPFIISDEIYHGLVYEGTEHSILEFTEHAFVLNGFSKLHAMTGLRLGYLIAPKAFIRPIQKIQQNFFISANAVIQKAGIAALREAGPDVARMKATYNRRRLFMIDRLKALGFGITVPPTGAFYVFANARHLSGDSYRLAFDILEKAHVGGRAGHRFRPARRGLPAVLLRQFPGEYRRGNEPARNVPEQTAAAPIGRGLMIIKTAEFVTSAVKPSQYPPGCCPKSPLPDDPMWGNPP